MTVRRRTWIHGLLLGLIFTALGIGAGPAQAAKGGITAINISPQIASDNDRYVAFQRRNGVPVVLDTWSGKIRNLKGAIYCQPRDIGGRRVLLICPHERPRGKDTGFRARTGSVLGGKTRRLPHAKELYDAFEIGRYWVSIPTPRWDQSQSPVNWYLNWRKGNARGVWFDDPAGKWGVDLNRAKIKPAKVKRFTPEFKGYPNPFHGEPSYFRARDVVITEWKNELRLWWDRDTSVRLGRGGVIDMGNEWLSSLRVGENWVTWSKGPTVHGYNYRTGQTYKRRYAKKALIAPVRDGVVVAKKVKRFGRYYVGFRVALIRP
ncbi:MAG: hypothetical protein J0H98_11730 [Solirubrobacterales bacterium]|nr:hypothetical protein [Solirubrobacterales bacterium]